MPLSQLQIWILHSKDNEDNRSTNRKIKHDRSLKYPVLPVSAFIQVTKEQKDRTEKKKHLYEIDIFKTSYNTYKS